MALPPYFVYRDELTSLFHGLPLWEPDPTNLYEEVSVGDVGFVREGCFIRMFNVLVPRDDPSNDSFGVPNDYHPLELGHFMNIRESTLSKGDYFSRYVTAFRETMLHSSGPDE
jgi:hypothetical protein